MLHTVCPITKFHTLATINSKAVVPNMKAMIEQIKHTFKTHIEVIHTNRESSLNGLAFRNWCRDYYILLHITMLDTPEQNGPSKRAGGLITKQARYKI